jgi:hypothetical protein
MVNRYDYEESCLMPSYDFLNKQTNEVEEHRMSYTVLEQFKLDNPHLELYISAQNLPIMSDGMRMSVPGIGKADSTFEKYVIGRMKEQVGQNTIKDGHKTKAPREW